MIEERPVVNEVYAKLIKARADFGKAVKNAKNPHFKNDYADLKSVLSAVTDALLENDLFVTQKVERDIDLFVVRTLLFDSNGDSIDFGIMPIKTVKDDAQGFGSGLTYARRYALMSAFGLAPEDDDGNLASGEVVKSPPVNQALANAQKTVVSLGADLMTHGYPLETIQQTLNNVPSSQLTLSQAQDAIQRLTIMLQNEEKKNAGHN